MGLLAYHQTIREKMTHLYPKSKLTALWKTNEEILLIDLGHDYFTVKFLKEENMNMALHGGPWFINGFFISIRRCQPNFVASSAKETITAFWLRLPELPTQYYDHKRLYMKGTVSCAWSVDAWATPTWHADLSRK